MASEIPTLHDSGARARAWPSFQDSAWQSPRNGHAQHELLAASAPYESLGRFERLDAAELIDCVRALCAGARVWRATASALRRAALLAALESWRRRRLQLGNAGARALGLEADAHLLREVCPDTLPPAHSSRSSKRLQLALVRAHWSELADGPIRDSLQALLSGQALLLATDVRWPLAAEAWLECLLEAGVEPAALGLLHGVGPRELCALAAAEQGWRACWSGPARELEPLRAALQAAGLPARRLALRTLVAGERVLEAQQLPSSADALSDCLQALLATALGPSVALSGQAPGHTAVLVLPARRYAECTRVLLELWPGIAQQALPLVDSAAVEAFEARVRLGLDTGACLVAGGERASARGTLERSSGRRVLPALFVNVERGSKLARGADPLPVLSLVRGP